MSRLSALARYVLAFLGLFAVIQPVPVLFIPPDPFSQLIASGVTLVLAVPATVVFVRRSLSVQRLFLYILCMFVAAFVVLALTSFVLTGIGASYAALADYGLRGILFQTFLLLVSYAIAFHLVYRGGYARLKARFA
ncbi:hypothetical protein [Halococcus sp. IIIV-5B]|uniref:hypothetical protein n=1 Tax=Halococcus sp. IIIV-5B TaxID=2321230 RepID=UPI000E74370C|nr:hypothetical protein [Halococcus sp. IIIV-5B]RJT06139.1 hypothetical protein D3261_06330 [Halococcus sp. IIIV-5B]